MQWIELDGGSSACLMVLLYDAGTKCITTKGREKIHKCKWNKAKESQERNKCIQGDTGIWCKPVMVTSASLLSQS